MDEIPLLSWLHISDLHIQDSDRCGRLAMARLLGDLDAKSQWYENEFGDGYGPPPPQVIFVTGDTAFSGDARGKREYEAATQFLDKVCNKVEVPRNRVYIVPGNHDVHRDIVEREALHLFAASPESHDQQAELRFKNYSIFASQFAQVNSLGGHDCSWRTEIEDVPSARFTLIGLNTALLSATAFCEDDGRVSYESDQGRLRLDERVKANLITTPMLGETEITIVLMHHPLYWLQTQPLFRQRTILLHGHTHEPDITRIHSSDNSQIITAIAGAVHLGGTSQGSLERLGYSVGAIYADENGYRVNIWPRAFVEKQREVDGRYYLDIVNVPRARPFVSMNWPGSAQGRPFAQHKLFWSAALQSAVRKPQQAVQVVIAAHSAWYTFQPRGGAGNWDKRLFESTNKPLQPRELEGDVWGPLLECHSKHNMRFKFLILLAHPYGPEARCVLLNQMIAEQDRHAEKDFFRTLRSIHLLSRSELAMKGVIEFDVRVLNPLYRVMTFSMYAVENHILYLPLDYSGLADSGFAVSRTGHTVYGRHLTSILGYFQEGNYIGNAPDGRYSCARIVSVDKLPASMAIDEFIQQLTCSTDFSWLGRAATRRYPLKDSDKPGTFDTCWAV